MSGAVADERAETAAQSFARRWAEVKAASGALNGLSPAERLARCGKGTIERVLSRLRPIDYQRLHFDWSGFWARPKQLPPAWEWDQCLYVAGRAFGKTRVAAEWVRARIESGAAKEIALIGPSFGDVRRYMVGGEERRADGENGSGLLDVMPPWVRYELNEQWGEIHFPDHGARAYFVSAEKPEFRGPNPDTVWGDELVKWPHPERLLENIEFANRKRGRKRPQSIYTTTPRPLEFLRRMILDVGTATIHGVAWENRNNVAPAWIAKMLRTKVGTRVGLEELEAEMLGDNPDSLFAASVIDQYRVDEAPTLDRIVVAIDPAVSTHRKSDETGIVASGRLGSKETGHIYVLGDRTGSHSPEQWGAASFELAEAVGASSFVVERNRAGDLAAANLKASASARGYSVEMSRHGGVVVFVGRGLRIEVSEVLAIGDKGTRARPVSTLYELGRVHHVGRLAELEDEQTEWNPRSGVSPNRLDAMVHGVLHLTGLDQKDVDGKSSAELMRGLAAANARLRASDPGRSAERSSVDRERRGLGFGGRYGSRVAR